MGKRLIAFLIIPLLIVFFASDAIAYWPNTTFNTCRNINITNTMSGSVAKPSNYQIPVNLTFTTNASDYSDVRFFNDTCNGASSAISLNHWSENSSSSSWDYEWIQLDSIPANTVRNISVLYNNTSVAIQTTSNGNNTFVMFDNFAGTTAINTTTWNQTTNAVIISGVLQLGTSSNVTTLATYEVNTSVRTLMNISGPNADFQAKAGGYIDSSGSNYITATVGVSGTTNLMFATSVAGSQNLDGANARNIFNVWEVRRNGTGTVQLRENNTILGQFNASFPTGSINVGFYCSNGACSTVNGYNMSAKWIFVRNYTEPEISTVTIDSSGTTKVIVDTPINLTNNPVSPTTYSSSQNYRLNATVGDSSGLSYLSTVWVQSNLTYGNATFANTSNITTLVNVNSTHENASTIYSALPAGSYIYKWCANDTSNNVQCSANQTYTVNAATPTTSLSFSSGTSNTTYPTSITPFCFTSNLDSNARCSLFANLTTVTPSNQTGLNNSAVALNAGWFNFTANNTATQNYSATNSPNSSMLIYFQVLPANFTIDLFLNGTAASKWYANSSATNFTVLTNITNTSVITLRLDSNLTGWTNITNTSTTIQNTTSWNANSIVSSNMTAYISSNSNYTSNSSTWNFQQDPQSPVWGNRTNSNGDQVQYVNPAQTHKFNMSFSDQSGSGMSSVIFNFNAVNYSATNTSNNYTYTLTGTDTGTYSYYWIGNDSVGNSNTSSTFTYTITASGANAGGSPSGGSSTNQSQNATTTTTTQPPISAAGLNIPVNLGTPTESSYVFYGLLIIIIIAIGYSLFFRKPKKKEKPQNILKFY